MMPIIGKTMSKGVPAIPFVVVGFILFAVYSVMSAKVSPDVGKWDFFFPLALRALGISMVQLPLINQAVVGLQPKDYASGIALNNMIRQLGGAFGIAIANNYIANHYAVHRTSLVSNLTQGSPAFTQRLNTIAHGLSSGTNIDSASAAHTALSIINSQVDKQAYYLSYLDTFKLIAIFFIAVIPLVTFLRTKKKTNGNDGAASKAMLEAH